MKQIILTAILVFIIFVSCDTKKTSPIQSKPGISIMYIEDTSKLSIQEKNQIIIIKNQEAIIRNQENLLSIQGAEFKNQDSVLNNQENILKNHDSMLNNQESIFNNQENLIEKTANDLQSIENLNNESKNVGSMYEQLVKIGKYLKIQQKQIDSMIVIKMKY